MLILPHNPLLTLPFFFNFGHVFGALAGVGGYGWMPYFAMGICAMMAVLFNIQKKIVETKVKTD